MTMLGPLQLSPHALPHYKLSHNKLSQFLPAGTEGLLSLSCIPS